jgi:hypothetical protein
MCTGSCEAPFLGWEALCDDLRESTLEHLSVRDLAGAAATCRDFQKAYLDLAAEERANLIASAEDAFGEGLFSGFVLVLRRALLGLTAFHDRNEGGESEVVEANCGGMVITSAGETKYATTEELEEDDVSKWQSSNEPCAMISKPSLAGELLEGAIEVQDNGVQALSMWSMYKCGETHILLGVDAAIRKAAPVLGLILAACPETPDASLQSPTPLKTG